MKKKHIKYALTVGFVVFLIACSVKKDRYLNRKFHAVTTEYNILYNGNIALETGITSLNATVQDNFWEILPIERMQPKEEDLLPGQTKNKDFERAEDKAVKAIQKHSMNIGGTEKNPEMDEAYLLLAKARYYDGRFIPSLEALNYILYKYPLSDRIYHSKIWREKVNIRLDNDEVALKNLKKLVADKKIEGQDLADAHAMLTQAYINLKAKDSAVATLKIAKTETKIKEEQARYTFILGQLYTDLNYKDSAFAAYQEVIEMNRKAPRRFLMQAHAKQALLFDYEKGDTLVFVEKFNELLEDRENRPYLDILNHQMGLFYDKLQKDEKAIKFYKKSLKSAPQDNYLVASNYRNIGEIYFEKALYKLAGNYYDSTLVKLNDKTREHRYLKKKRESLDDVIKYEGIVQKNDSILKVVAFSEDERKTYYEKHIAALKIADEKKAFAAAELAKKEAIKKENDSKNAQLLEVKSLSKDLPTSPGQPKGGIAPPNMPDALQKSAFYFYNATTVAFGKQEFMARWGKRTLKENWKWKSNKDAARANFEPTDSVAIDTVVLPKENSNSLYDVATYIKQIPTDKKILDSLAIERNYAYFQLGLLYKEKFKENQLAANRLEQLLKNNPEEKLILPAKYNLYKIYQEIDPEKAEQLKQAIIAAYPNSRYAEILKNPKSVLEDASNPEQLYAKQYKKLATDQVREAAVELDQLVAKFEGDDAVAKFLFLQAQAAGKLEGLEVYKSKLTKLAADFPNLIEGKEAAAILATDIPKLEALQFSKEEASEWKLIFPKAFVVGIDPKLTKDLFEKIDKYLKDTGVVTLKKSIDCYTKTEDIIVLHGFQSKESALGVLTVLKEHKNYKIKDTAYCISTEDYKVVVVKKRLTKWIEENK